MLGLGSKHWPMRRTIRMVPQGTPIGAFDTTFGPVLPNLKELITELNPTCIRIHLWWSYEHIICPLWVIEKRAPKYEELALQNPDLPIYLSHSCEHNEHKKRKVKKRITLLHELAPHCIPVNCIWRGAIVKNCVTEKHENSEFLKLPKPCITSNDGTELSESAMNRYIRSQKRRCEVVWLWNNAMNLRDKNASWHPPPKQRNRPPKRKDFKQLTRHLPNG